MNYWIQNAAELRKLEHEKSFSSTENADTNEETNMSIKDPETMLSVIVLLLVCLGLAALAHVVV